MDFTFKTVDIYLVDLQIISYFLIIQILIFFLRFLFDISPFNMLLRAFVKFLLKVIHLFPALSGYA